MLGDGLLRDSAGARHPVTAPALADLVGALEAALADPRGGLPEEVFRFVSRITPLCNVDLLIQDAGLGTLLTWREDEFFGTGWHLPGGIIRFKETAAARVRACAREELDAAVAFDETPLAVAESIGAHDTRGHHIGLLFRCRLLTDPDPSRRAGGGQPRPGQWRWHPRCPADLLDTQRPYATHFIEV
jgi:colanic acid biosynthesis protein WcaH